MKAGVEVRRQLRERGIAKPFTERPDSAGGDVVLGDRQVVPDRVGAHVVGRQNLQVDRQCADDEDSGGHRFDHPARLERPETEPVEVDPQSGEFAGCGAGPEREQQERPGEEEDGPVEVEDTAQKHAAEEGQHADGERDDEAFVGAQGDGQ
ncbi:MAG TPA: hypothetical protein VI456_05595 [Polyangia bacterium]